MIEAGSSDTSEFQKIEDTYTTRYSLLDSAIALLAQHCVKLSVMHPFHEDDIFTIKTTCSYLPTLTKQVGIDLIFDHSTLSRYKLHIAPSQKK